MIRYISDAPNAPKAIGPYSQAAIIGNLAFLSGQVPIDPATGALVGDDIEAQTQQVLDNIRAVLRHLDRDFSHLVKSTIFLTDMTHFAKVNAIYERELGGVRPARSTIQVAALPLGAKVEIETIVSME